MSSQSNTTNWSDICLVCQVSRENHGDSRHKFSTDGQLVPVEQGPPPKQEAPRVRTDMTDREQVVERMQSDVQANAVIRLTEVLIDKKLIDSKDVLYIFSGIKP